MRSEPKSDGNLIHHIQRMGWLKEPPVTWTIKLGDIIQNPDSAKDTGFVVRTWKYYDKDCCDVFWFSKQEVRAHFLEDLLGMRYEISYRLDE